MLLQKFRNARNDEGGFTLIELLVVILIIGILAAIALPTFLGQRDKAQDSSAKSNARNAVSMVESCFTDSQTYVGCNTDAAFGAPSGLTVVAADPAAGQVAVTGMSPTGYTVTAVSETNSNFVISKAAGVVTRSCTPVGDGGCPASGLW